MQNKRTTTIIVICVACAVLFMTGVASLLLSSPQQEESPLARLLLEQEKRDSVVTVNFNVNARDNEIQMGSGIPVQIEGTDYEGTPVSEMVLVDENFSGIRLRYGEYKFKFAGSPVSDSGVIYRIPSSAQPLKIDESSGSGRKKTVEISGSDFHFIEPDLVKDEQIDAIRTWMQEYGLEASRIDEVTSLIEQARLKAKKRIEAENLGAWRTRISGNFWGSARSFNVDSSIYVSFDSSKVVVTGGLQRSSESNSTPLEGNEWHFLLTDSTEYGYYQGGEFGETSREEFRDAVLPSKVPSIGFEVQDGYVKRISTSS